MRVIGDHISGMSLLLKKTALMVIADLLLAVIPIMLFFTGRIATDVLFIALVTIGAVALIRIGVMMIGDLFFYKKKIDIIRDLISQYKKGSFLPPKREQLRDRSELSDIYRELLIVGRHLKDIVFTQKEEIDNFHDFYNSIMSSISPYFLILDENEHIAFVNDRFSEKFNYPKDEIIGKRLDEIFYFINARIRGGVGQVIRTGRSIVLNKTHLMTLNKVSIIADIKISSIAARGIHQIIIIIDDVTDKLRGDSGISIISQISQSVQKEDTLDSIFYTVLTGVTAGSGLGFNRAMLFILEGDTLNGKMAVGPDSFEEAIDIWSSISAAGSPLPTEQRSEIRTGKALLKNVLMSRFSMKNKGIFARSCLEKKTFHVFDSWNDPEVGQTERELLDVKEFVLVPLVVTNKSVGVIIADNKFNQAPIGKDAVELLQIFASQAAMLINSRMKLDVVANEKRKIEAQKDGLIESEKLAAVGRIASNIAHEIRNPLVTMGGYARRIAQLARDGKKVESIIDAAHIILKESERLEKTLSNVMDFTRPAKYIKEFNSINMVIKDTVDLLKNIFFEKRIEIELDLFEDIPLVKSDVNQMKQVMLNLIQNALDATPQGGLIGVKSRFESNSIIITVFDTGSGIEGDSPEVVFEPFYTTKMTGVGLGLPIVKKIIKDHGGEIRVANRPEGGTDFTIRLPVPL